MLAQYTARQRLIPALFLVYTSIAMAGGHLSPKAEFFPFFNWSLFTVVSDQRKLCEIELLAINGTPLAAPTRFYDLPNQFAAARSKSTNVIKLACRMVAAHTAADKDRFEKLRKVLETSYLSGASQVTYRLVRYTYNPVERWRDGSVQSIEVIGEYAADRSS